MRLSTDSWVYRLATANETVFGYDPPPNLSVCSLFWRLVSAIPFLVFTYTVFLVGFMLRLRWIGDKLLDGKGNRFGSTCVGSAVVLALGLLVSSVWLFGGVWFTVSAFLAAGALAVLVGLTIVSLASLEERSYVLVEYIKALKGRVCPIIQVDREGES